MNARNPKAQPRKSNTARSTALPEILEFEPALPSSEQSYAAQRGDWAVRWVSYEGRTYAETVLVEGRSKLTSDERGFVLMVAEDVSCDRLVASPLSARAKAAGKPSRGVMAQLRAIAHATLTGSFLRRHCE